MTKRFNLGIFAILISIILFSCSDPECYEFTSEDNEWFPYSEGDTLIFGNSEGDTLTLVADEVSFISRDFRPSVESFDELCVNTKVMTFHNILGKGRTEKFPFEMHYYIQNVGDQFVVIFSEVIVTPKGEEYYFNNAINLNYTFNNGSKKSLIVISDSTLLNIPRPEFTVFRYGFDKSGVKIFNLGLDPDATFELIEQK